MEEYNLSEKLMIRNYEPPDLADCRRLWIELTEWLRQIYDSPAIGGDNPGIFFDRHLDQVGPENIWVADVSGRIIALTGLIIEDKEAEREPLVVLGELRGYGVGRKLAETVIEQSRKAGMRQLKVRPVGRNEAAIRFFHKLGFNIMGHIELFQELKPEEAQNWQEKETVAGRNFKV